MRTKIALVAIFLSIASAQAATLQDNIKIIERGAVTEKDANELKEAIKAVTQEGAAAVKPLMQSLANAQTNLQKVTILDIIGTLEQPPAIAALAPNAPVFMKLLESDHLGVKYATIKIIGNIRHKAAIPELQKLATHKEEAMRTAVADALGKIGDRSVLEVLVPMISDPEKNVRLHVIRALANIGAAVGTGKEATPIDVVDELITVLRKGDANERVAVVDALKKIVGYEIDKNENWLLAHTAVKREPVINEMNDWWRRARTKSVYRIADKEMQLRINVMLEANEKKEIRLAAVKSLTKIADKSTVMYLIRVMRHDDADIREIAAPVASRLADIPLKYDRATPNMRWLDEVNDFEKRWIENRK